MMGLVKFCFVLFQWFLLLLPQFAQDPSTFGWQPFEIPGLPEQEQLILGNMLLSNNPSLQIDALETLLNGVSSGRVSSASLEYSLFLDQVFENLFLIRSQESSARLIQTHPRSIITFLDLLAYADDPLFQSRVTELFALTPQPFVYHHAMGLIDRHGKSISFNLEQSIAEVLRAESIAPRQPDGSLIRSILRAFRRAFLLHEVSMSNSTVQALLAIRNRTSDNSLRHEILDTLELMFNL